MSKKREFAALIAASPPPAGGENAFIHRRRHHGAVICIIGNKGGTGKTTLSHMLSQGFGLLGQRSACVLTDTPREPLSPDGRRYLTADARSPEALGKVMDKLRTLNGWMGVIDGGGNRTEIDRKLYSLANVVLLPFRDSHEDIRTVVKDLEMFPRAWALPSQWPSNPWQREAAQRRSAHRQHLGADPRPLARCRVGASPAEVDSRTTSKPPANAVRGIAVSRWNCRR